MVGEGAAVLVARVFQARAIDPPRDALPRFLAIYDGRLLNHTCAYEGVHDTLPSLTVRAPLAVLTNKPLAATRRILDGLDLARFFDSGAVIGGDGPFPRKPDPSGLQHLAMKAHVPIRSALLVGDSPIDWETASRASAGICLARYGFGFEGFPIAQLRADDRVIDSPTDLLRL